MEQSERVAWLDVESPEDAGRLRSEALERLLAISCSMSLLSSRDALLSCIRDCLQELFDAENSLAVLVDEDGRLQPMRESDSESPGELCHSLIERVLQEKRALLIGDARLDPELREKSSTVRLGLRSVLCAPLLAEGRVIGVIQFDHRNEPGPFTAEDLRILELFARQAAVALQALPQRARLREALERQRELEAQVLVGERLRALGEMASAMAHDFNNLLMTTMGIGELMRESDELPDELREDVDTLCSAARTGAAVVRRLQEFGDSSVTAAEPEPVDLSVELARAIEMCRARFAERGEQRAEFVVDTDQVSTVMGRADEVRDVLFNLLINAIEAMPNEGTVTARTREESGWIVVEIEDTGPGIDPAVLGRVFEPFFSTKEHGHGLGLAICWGITRRMGGEINLHPGTEGGTTCRIRLPAAGTQADAEVSSRLPSTSASLDVLVVDDNPRVLDVLSRMVKRLGHDVAPALGSEEGLRSLEDGSYDTVITDYDMPGMNGLEFAARVREHQPRSRIVLLTGWSQKRFDLETEHPIFDLTLVKPVTLETLGEAIGRVEGRVPSR